MTRSSTRHRARVAWSISLAVLCSGPAWAAPLPSTGLVSVRYDVHWGPVKLFSIESETLLDAEGYKMGVTVRTGGMVGWFVDWSSRSETTGSLRADSLRPLRRTSRSEYAGKSLDVNMEYGEDGPLRVEVDPDPESEGLEPVSAELRGATVDPETATLVMIRRNAEGLPCTGVERVFDGRLRYDLHLADAGRERLELDGDVRYDGPARLCDATVQAIAGYPRENPEEWGAGMRFRYWLAPVLAGTLPIPGRIDVVGKNGTLSAYVAEARVIEPPPAEARAHRPPEGKR
jgi:hypothetical protein